MPKLMKTCLFQIVDDQLPIDYKKESIVYLEHYAELIEEIIIEKPLVKGGKVKEFLTGVEFDSMYYGIDIISLSPFVFDYVYKSKNRCIDTCISLCENFSLDFLCTEASDEDILKYINEHRNVEAFKKHLEDVKVEGQEKAERSIELYNQRHTRNEVRKNKTKSLVLQTRINREKLH